MKKFTLLAALAFGLIGAAYADQPTDGEKAQLQCTGKLHKFLNKNTEQVIENTHGSEMLCFLECRTLFDRNTCTAICAVAGADGTVPSCPIP